MATINPIDSSKPIEVAKGGTGAASFNANAPLCAGTTSTGAFQDGGTNNANQFLVSNGAAALPTWQTVRSQTGSKTILGCALLNFSSTTVATWCAPFGGTSGPTTTAQATAQLIIPFAGTISKFYVNAATNGSTTNVTVTINKNSVNTLVVATLTASTPGKYSDTTHSFSVSAGDLIQFEIQKSTTAGWSGMMCCLLTAS